MSVSGPLSRYAGHIIFTVLGLLAGALVGWVVAIGTGLLPFAC